MITHAQLTIHNITSIKVVHKGLLPDSKTGTTEVILTATKDGQEEDIAITAFHVGNQMPITIEVRQ